MMAAALERANPSLSLDIRVPDGGFYIWCGIPDGVDQSALMAGAGDRGVTFLPGRACFAAEPPENAIRLNFTHCAEDVHRCRDRAAARCGARDGSRRRPGSTIEGASTAPVV